MKMKAKTILGAVAYEFFIDGDLDKKSLHKLIVLANPRKVCTSCEDDGYADKYFTSNKDKDGNVYVNVKCKCGARSKLGSYKTGGFFWHEYEVYKKPTEEKTEAKADEPPPPGEVKHDEDIPF